MVVPLMDEERTSRFESACIAAGSRFIGGVFACAALAQYQLTGEETYYALTPTDIRKTPAEFMTTGWFTGMIPITIPIAAESFGETARAAQACFDSNIELAKFPFYRVFQFAPSLRRSHHGFPMVSYLDSTLPPLSSVVTAELDERNAAAYMDGRTPAHFCMWVGRASDETSLTAFFPDNPVARESVSRYVELVKSVFVAVAEGRDDILCAPEVAPA